MAPASSNSYPSSEWITLKFTTPDPTKTELLDEAGRVVYSTDTDQEITRPVTTFYDAYNRPFATLGWRWGNADKITFVGQGNGTDEKRVAITDWLRAKWRWRSRSLKLVFESGGKKYAWLGITCSQLLKPLHLIDLSDESKGPLAYHIPCATVREKRESDTIPPLSSTHLSRAYFTPGGQFERDAVFAALLTEKLWYYGGAGGWESSYNPVAWRASAKVASNVMRDRRERKRGDTEDSSYKRLVSREY